VLAQLKYTISFTSKYNKPDLWIENRARKAKLFSPDFCCNERTGEIFAARCSTNLAQLSTTFILPIKQNGGAGKKNGFF